MKKTKIDLAVPDRLEIKYLPVDALVPYSRNPRTHSEDQVAQIAASIREFGFTRSSH
jgi:ParB-like chromosome segregation protein Spo0J